MASIQPANDPKDLPQLLKAAVEQVNEIVFGKNEAVELAFTCLLARGHLLIEDIPGVGKTTLAQALAVTMGTNYQRVQFTSDLLPADILGVSIYRRDEERFEFHPGPVFSHLLLADEVNRATPKTQSALLEAMAENNVTVEGKTRALPEPFFVIATQNPLDATGTFPLPDSQLDRFLMSISLGYPSRDAERRVLTEPDRQLALSELAPVISVDQLAQLQALADRVLVSEPVLDYIQSLIETSRTHPALKVGLSPRAGLALVRGIKALATIRQREFALPEDVQTLFPHLAQHRLQVRSGSDESVADIARKIVDEQAIP